MQHLSNRTIEMLFDFLNQFIGNYPKDSVEREMIRLTLYLGYKYSTIEAIFKNWNILYPKNTPEESIALCNKFIREDVGMELDFYQFIEFLKEKFPKKSP